MSNVLSDAWTWDMWFADDGEQYHAFYLKASRALGNPDRRHFYVTVGHAVSDDLHTWHEVADALIASDQPAFDDYTTWTGSIVRDTDGTWRMFYTGTTRAENATVQRVGVATSPDLYTWTKQGSDALCEADARWYEKFDGLSWPDEAWRDPWVFAHGGQWHMLITARSNGGALDDRGVIGHATSPDLHTWTVQPPRSQPGAGFGHLEVPQVATVDGRHVLIFSSLHGELTAARRDAGERGGVWSVPIDSPVGPYDIAGATRLTDESLYAGRLLRDRDGSWWLFAFNHVDDAGEFIGSLSDPLPVGWDRTGRLRVTDGRFGDLR
ncbi:glycosyl hydrolase family 32 [Georgenia sp. H159]|uniref:glycosyl hydrolase family 32 n=1 Tax=Georgenia sp. H159 TaxID=3076115 RepID=UPI002D79389C|nr:glycosyl hydrolase family 32 [Georgenia sp. H159]